MIDKERFLTGMALLAGAFGREVDGAVQRMYYAVLSVALSTEEFESAINIVLCEQTFWPAPATILAAVKADASSRGSIAFEHVNRVMADCGGHRFLSHETFHREFDRPTQAAIRGVGGLAVIANATEESSAALRRRFMVAYVDAGRPKLARRATDARVRQLVSETAAQIGSGMVRRGAGQ